MSKVLCKRCGEIINHLDILHHAMDTHNDQEAKMLLEKMEWLKNELRFKRFNIDDLFDDELLYRCLTE